MDKEVVIRDFVKNFSNVANWGFRDDEQKVFNEAFSCEHRTLQQSMFGAVAKLVLYISSDEYRTDGRNVASKEMAKMFIDGYIDQLVKRQYKRFIDSGYDEETAVRMSEGYRKDFESNPSMWLTLPCV